MISPIFSAITANFSTLPGMSSVLIQYAENRSEQGGPRRLCMYPVRGVGAGPNFYTVTNAALPKMLRKRWVMCRFECWGLPGATQIQNTDDAENILGALVNTIERSVLCDFKMGAEAWNQNAEVMMYGRCVILEVQFEIPVPEIVPETAFATLVAANLSGDLETDTGGP